MVSDERNERKIGSFLNLRTSTITPDAKESDKYEIGKPRGRFQQYSRVVSLANK